MPEIAGTHRNRKVTVPGLATRGIRAGDGPGVQSFVQGLSKTSRRYRFWSTLDELSPKLLAALVEANGPHQVCFVAEVASSSGGVIIAEARYASDAGYGSAEIAVSVTDRWQRQGIATQLLQILWSHAEARGLAMLYCNVQPTNEAMLALAKSSGFVEADSCNEPGSRRFEKRRQIAAMSS